MRRLSRCWLVAAGLAAVAWLSAQAVPSKEKRVELFGKKLSFVLPVGFTQLSKGEHDLKYSRLEQNRPQVSYGNAERNISIAVTRPPGQLGPEQLPNFLEAVSAFIGENVEGIEWRRKEIVTIGGTKWARMEFIAPALDTNIYNDMYFTSLGGQPVGVNLNAVVRLEKQAVKAFATVRGSLRVREGR